MDIPIPVDLGRIAQDLQIKRVQVESVVQLLDEGNTVPFITRYRKERTGNLNEVVIREIQLRVQRLRELAERKETILKTIEAQGKLEPDLAAAIRAADNPKRLEDLYLPFKPKKRTKASDARERGLEPLAVRIWHRDETLTDVHAAAEAFLNAEKGIDSVDKVLEGVGHILSEAISEMATVRDAVRKVVWKTGRIVTSKAEISDGQGLEFRDYFEYTEPISQIPPHRVLAINRGDKEGSLKVKLEVSRPDVEAAMFGQLSLDGHPQHELFHAAAIDALDRLILPSMEREVRRDLTESAEKHAVEVFARNLGSLLLQPPIPKQPVLAIDPGFKNGCKVAVLDAAGQLVDHAVIYPHAPENRRSEAKIVLKDMVGRHGVGVVAIGNGTACRETEELIAEIIAEGTRFSQGEPEPEAESGIGAEPESEAGIAEAGMPAVATAEPDAGGPVEGTADAAEAESTPEPAAEAAQAEFPPESAGPVAESVHEGSAPTPESVPHPAADVAHHEAPAAEAGHGHAEIGGGAPVADLGNGSSGEAHEAREPHAHSETPVEMLPPISGGAPD
ncbi:MAG: Tex-like N-terminal domain-containing protein, partial [Isosphaeraceae bacterium]